jgi:hypothetical protein
MSYYRVKDHNHLIRDSSSKAILNTDVEGLKEYYAKKQLAKKHKEEKEETKERLIKLENDMQDIKSLLMEIDALRK